MSENSKAPQRQTVIQAVKFTLFSASAGLIQLGSYALFHDVFHMEHYISYLVSLVLSVLWNFTFNRRFTFHDSGNVPKAMLLVALFYAVFTPLTTWGNKVLSERFTAQYMPYVLEIGTMLLNFVTEFIYDKLVVFRHPKKVQKS